MATNDFLAAGGDGYDMLSGKREEDPSLDTVFTDYLKTNVTQLGMYQEPFPNQRIVSISEEALVDKFKKEVNLSNDLPKTGERPMDKMYLGIILLILITSIIYSYKQKKN